MTVGVVTIYDWSDLRPKPDRLADVDVTTPRGRLLAEWTESNRRVRAEYYRRRRAQEAWEKGRGLWQEADHAAQPSSPTFDTASITIKTVSIVDGVEVLTLTVNPD